jgi:Flp pilus assembly pilin Flp
MGAMEITGTESGFIAGALAVVLLGAILGVLSSHMDVFTKLSYVLYDMGLIGLSFGLLNEALEENKDDAIRASLAIAGALVLLALRL